jgi:hypothetical protein
MIYLFFSAKPAHISGLLLAVIEGWGGVGTWTLEHENSRAFEAWVLVCRLCIDVDG